MALFLVMYDLVKEESSLAYEPLWSALEALNGVKTQRSSWLVGYDATQRSLFDYLKPSVDGNDRLMIVEITKRPNWTIGFKGTAAIINRYFPA